MKQKVPNIINIEVSGTPEFYDQLFIKNSNTYLDKGYNLSKHDFERYCAILIADLGIEQLPDSYKNLCFQNNVLCESVRFKSIKIKLSYGHNIPSEDQIFYYTYSITKVRNRKAIIREEIKRVGINPKKVSYEKSSYLRTLISIIKDMDDEITLIPWFIPIKLSFKVFVHIYVKHVEETKFAEGAFKNRTYFSYELDQIWILLKSILYQEKESIQDHFLEVSVGQILKENEKIKAYHRGFKSFPAITFNGNSFALTIDHKGYITKFHQL